MSEPLTKSGDWSYCPACGGRIDTGYECGQCGRDWLEYHQTGAALRAQLEKYQRDKQIGDVLMLEGSQKIDELRAQLAQMTAERDAKSLALQRVHRITSCQACHGRGIWRDRLTENEWGPPYPCPKCTEPLEHQLAEVQARIKELDGR